MKAKLPTILKNLCLALVLICMDKNFLSSHLNYALGLNHIAEALALLCKIIYYLMLFYLANSRWLSIRITTGIIFAVFLYADEVFKGISGGVISIPDMDMMLTASVLWKDAIVAYSPFIFNFKNIILIGLFLAFYIWLPKRRRKTEPFIDLIIQAGILTTFIVNIFQFPHDSDEYLDMYMPFIRIPAEIILVQNNPINTKREVLTAKPARPGKVRNIIFVIDESISYDYFFKGNPNVDLAFHEKYKDLITDFGESASGSNCSYGSRSYLRFAATPESIQNKTALSTPTIWQYAENAGFKSYLIGYTPLKANLLTKQEAALVDHYEHMWLSEYRPYYEVELAKKIKQQIQENRGNNFFYASKEGMHFPYEDGYPEDQAVYNPHLSQNESLMNAEKTRNSYRNSLKWSVDSFFDELFKDGELDMNETVVIYTSDHGEFINTEDNFKNLIPQPHCSMGAPKADEFKVPLMVFTSNKKIKEGLSKSKHASHFHIIPTILKLMGYDATGKSLFDKEPGIYPSFYGDPYGRFNPVKIFEAVIP